MQRVSCLLALLPLVVSAQPYGRPPAPGLGATDVLTAFKLPALKDTDSNPVEAMVLGLQVGKRAKALGLTGKSPIDAWTSAQMLLASSSGTPPARIPGPSSPFIFSGTTASALNQLLARSDVVNVRVASSIITIDQPIELLRSGITLDLGSAQLMSATTQPYMLRIEHVSNVTVMRGDFISGDSAILVNAANGITVTGVQIGGLSGAGITVTHSVHVLVSQNRISGVGLAGIMIHTGTAQSIVQSNQVTGGTGFGNLMAGIVLSDREVDITSNPRVVYSSDGYHVFQQPMLQRLNPPHDNAIVSNDVTRNNSSGIYVDGTVRNVIALNVIAGNAKEGLCLDDGATANVVTANAIEDNGQRWGESDVTLAHEYILSGGRLPDGTPAEKVPGISIDNALYNVVFANSVTHNFGGGIKIVRTGYFNLIGVNTLYSDNDGAGDTQHFFGVELGAASGDASEPDLDFTPSRGNIVFSNNIRGTHYSGIFFDAGSDQNDILNNIVFDAQNWALESAGIMSNNSLNNLTNLPSRNIGSGLDAALVTSGQPVNDPPPPAPAGLRD